MLAITVASGPTAVAAAPKRAKAKSNDLKAEQIAYSKELYGQGVAAMDAKDYATALERFLDAYRYAPDLHLFTYNIASAAELSGDCRLAVTYYRLFLDLVPDHDKRAVVQKTYDRLQAECPYDAESTAAVTSVDRDKRDALRAREEADRSMVTALGQLRVAAAFYAAVHDRHADAAGFARAARYKRWHIRRMVRLMERYGVPSDPEPGETPRPVPDPLAAACRQARAMESRCAAAFEAVTAMFDARDIHRVMARFGRGSANRDRPAFDACAR